MLNAAALLKQTKNYVREIKDRELRRDYLEMAFKCFQLRKGVYHATQELNSTKAFYMQQSDCKVPHKITGPFRLRTPGTENGKTKDLLFES